ncbi:hypothetical protein Tco_1415323 [Tanacetum coccineum]
MGLELGPSAGMLLSGLADGSVLVIVGGGIGAREGLLDCMENGGELGRRVTKWFWLRESVGLDVVWERGMLCCWDYGIGVGVWCDGWSGENVSSAEIFVGRMWVEDRVCGEEQWRGSLESGWNVLGELVVFGLDGVECWMEESGELLVEWCLDGWRLEFVIGVIGVFWVLFWSLDLGELCEVPGCFVLEIWWRA